MTSCGRGRDSATLECFGRGYRGTIFVRSSKLSLFFPELCLFRRFFCFPALLKDLAPKVQALGLLVSTMFWGSFWKLRSVTGHFCELLQRPQVFLENFLSFFQSTAGFTCACLTAMAIPSLSKALWWWYVETRMKTRLPGVGEIERRGPSIVFAIGTSRVRWSMVQKRKKKHKEVSVWLCEGSTLHHLQTSEFWGACFRDPTSLPFHHFAVFVDVDVQLQDGQAVARGTAKKSSHPWHFRSWSLRRNELECTDLVHWTEALHRFSSRDAIIVVGSVLEKHLDGDFTPDQEKEITFKRWPPGYQSWKLGMALNGLSKAECKHCVFTPRFRTHKQ